MPTLSQTKPLRQGQIIIDCYSYGRMTANEKAKWSKHVLDLDKSDCASERCTGHFDQCLITLSKLCSLSNNLTHNVTPHGADYHSAGFCFDDDAAPRIKLCRVDTVRSRCTYHTILVLIVEQIHSGTDTPQYMFCENIICYLLFVHHCYSFHTSS